MFAAGWLAVAVLAAWLRFDHLGARPMHADEATGAKLTAMRMEGAGGQFDPKHFHGPLLGDAAALVCQVCGEAGWKQMTKETLRLLPAAAGFLLVLAPLLGVRRFGAGSMFVAGALLAASPLMVVYSRMFIHEMLLALFGALFLLVIGKRGTSWLPGLLLGLMYATKETVAISMLAWTCAAVVVFRKDFRREWLRPVFLNAAVAGLVSLAFYTHGFTHPRGAVDAVMTFFRYETVGGHDKPWDYYLRMLAWPVKSAGVWWFATPVALLAVVGAWRGIRTRQKWDIFLALALVGHLAIYGFFGYKTPWLMCLPWAHLCLLAGLAVRDLPWIGWSLTAFAIVTQGIQSRHVIGRIESDPRNPFAYVPTRRDVESLETWLRELKEKTPIEPLAVVGRDIWPLPWYLREFQTGYWIELPEGAENMPVVLLLPGVPGAEKLAATHTCLPRGLRDGVPVLVYLRHDLWETWKQK